MEDECLSGCCAHQLPLALPRPGTPATPSPLPGPCPVSDSPGDMEGSIRLQKMYCRGPLYWSRRRSASKEGGASTRTKGLAEGRGWSEARCRQSELGGGHSRLKPGPWTWRGGGEYFHRLRLLQAPREWSWQDRSPPGKARGCNNLMAVSPAPSALLPGLEGSHWTGFGSDWSRRAGQSAGEQHSGHVRDNWDIYRGALATARLWWQLFL